MSVNQTFTCSSSHILRSIMNIKSSYYAIKIDDNDNKMNINNNDYKINININNNNKHCIDIRLRISYSIMILKNVISFLHCIF
jgi:hypothetical protein